MYNVQAVILVDAYDAPSSALLQGTQRASLQHLEASDSSLTNFFFLPLCRNTITPRASCIRYICVRGERSGVTSLNSLASKMLQHI